MLGTGGSTPGDLVTCEAVIATGARTGTNFVLDVVDELHRRNGRYGVAAVSGAAGLGAAIVVERVS